MKLQMQICTLGLCVLLLTSCAPAQKGTQIGAGTGALVGGGLGAVVGHQTGNAGEGFVVGALAGAAAGTIIGNKFDEHQATLDAQRVEIERVKSESHASADELRLMRKQQNAGTSSKGVTDAYKKARPVSAERGRYGWESSKVAESPRSNSTKTTKPKSSYSSKKNSQKNSSYKPRKDVAHHESKRVETSRPKPKQEVEVVPQIMPQVPLPPRIEQPVAKVETPASPADLAPALPAEPSAPVELDNNPPTAIDPFADFDDNQNSANRLDKGSGTTDGQPLGAYKWGGSKECAQAGAEAQKGTSAADSADKLYHFRRAIRLCPGKADFHKLLADTYTSMGRKLDAEFEMGEAQRLGQ